MKLTLIILLGVLSISTFADSKKREPQSLQDRIRSEFGLDRFEVTCEFYVSGKDVRPRHSAYYEPMSKELCVMKGRRFLAMSPMGYEMVLIKHEELKPELIIGRLKTKR